VASAWSRNRQSSVIFNVKAAWVAATALLLQIVWSEVRAAGHEGFCARKTDALRAFVCEDDELASQIRSLDKILSNIATRMSTSEDADPEYSEEDCVNKLPTTCSSEKLREPSPRVAARPCLSQRIAEHAHIVAQFDLATGQPPFRLSPVELEIARNHIAPHVRIGWAFASDTAWKGLMRVVRAVTPTKDDADEFLKAFSGPGASVRIFENRFALGEQCMKHACSSEYSGVVLDLKSGEMVLAVHRPRTKVAVYEKKCVSSQLKKDCRIEVSRALGRNGARCCQPATKHAVLDSDHSV